MKKIYLILFLICLLAVANAQHKHTDSLYSVYNAAKTDTDKLNALIGLSYYYELAYPDSAIILGEEAYTISDKHNWISSKAQSLDAMANAYSFLGDYVNAMQLYLRGLRIFETIDDYSGMAHENNNIGATYIAKIDYKGALPYLRIAAKLSEVYTLSHKLRPGDMQLKAMIQVNMAEAFIYLHQIDSASYYLDKCYPAALKNNMTDLIGVIKSDMGNVQSAKGNKTAALEYFRSAEISTLATGDVEDLSIAFLNTAKLYHKERLQDSAEYYAKKAYETASGGKFKQDMLNAGQVLYGYYDEDNNIPLAYKYLKLTTAAKDSLYSQDRVKQLLSINFDEKQRQEDIAAAQEKYKDRVRTYLFIIGFAILLLVVIVIWRNGKQKQTALLQLQLTQKQLIQSEKMASLGELTAGIAHEIQNPLNFVNNFSEVNQEMLEELEQELDKGDIAEAKAITADIRQNESKINHHGKRADSIVKGMLEHSRTSAGQKELIDLNTLADEYLRLSYHGLRAKDKSFNAELITHFDPKLPKVTVIPQDIGRVLLNLFNNAFYAVNQKQKTAGPDYKPEVTVSTSAEKNNLIIKVKDNGNGIPDAIKDKIMQPFFTTKPTGEGTGLGLSLSYDIVVKGHGGSIRVETKEGQGTDFIVELPITNNH